LDDPVIQTIFFLSLVPVGGKNTPYSRYITQILAFDLRFTVIPCHPAENRPAVSDWGSILGEKDG